MRGKGNFGTGSSFNEEASLSSPSRLKNFSPRTIPPHSSGLMSSPMAGIEKRSIRENNPDSKGFADSHASDYGSTSYPVGSWDESAMSDNIVGRKVLEDNDDDEKSFSNFNLSVDTQVINYFKSIVMVLLETGSSWSHLYCFVGKLRKWILEIALPCFLII